VTTTDNSWVLITDASSGFGEEFARQYAEQGHSLVLVGRRLDRLQALDEALRRQYRIEVVVEPASRGACRHPRLAGRTHQRRAGLGEQGPRDPHLGDATLAATGLSLSCHERMTRISGQAVPSANDTVRRLQPPTGDSS
jgi:NAD(P)-dependent dehydrogenase (short-subunit alcohol dehydrogenase family)